LSDGGKECADLSGRRGHGHLLLVSTERRRPCLLLKVNKLRWRLAAQKGVAKSDFSPMHWRRSGFDYKRRAFRSDWSRSI